MKIFLFKVTMFVLIFSLMFFTVVFLPATPRASKSLLFAKIKKDALLQNTPSPRIIFIGGSNLSLGLDSKMVEESLGLNPINTAIHAAIGLIYMLDHSLLYIQQGDIVVVSPEYDFFYGGLAYGGEELLRTILDVSPSELWGLRRKQYANIIEYLPQYVTSKMQTGEYFNIDENGIYGINSFNKYGDVYTQWKLNQQKFSPFGPIKGKFNYSIITELCNFNKKCIEKGATMFVAFPDYQSTSFENSRNEIMKIESELKKKDFNLLGTPERYKMSDSLMFDSPYHLLKKGVDHRTKLLIEDIKKNVEYEKAQICNMAYRLSQK
jgi:hypothetical protein